MIRKADDASIILEYKIKVETGHKEKKYGKNI